MIRREEAERTARKLRLRKQAKVQSVTVEKQQPDPDIQRMQLRLAELEKLASPEPQLETAPSTTKESPELVQISQRLADIEKRMSSQVRNTSIFCYRCGIDSHMATECKNSPNKQLVQQKMETRRRERTSKN